jgi:carbonic anhydrase
MVDEAARWPLEVPIVGCKIAGRGGSLERRPSKRSAARMRPPVDADAVRQRLEEGYRSFAAIRAGELDYGKAPAQRPVAAVLGCADARAPGEIVFQQAVNDPFVVRVAGDVLASEQLGSLAYAAEHLGEWLRLVVVLGHSGCGAVSAAVDALLDPKNYPMGGFGLPIRSIIDPILVSVQIASRALARSGANSAAGAVYRAAL